MLEGVRSVWLAVESREADVPDSGLPENGFVGLRGDSEGVTRGASVAKRKPVESPMTCEKGL